MQWELYKLRKDNNKTQKDLAEYLGIDEATYRLKEKGRQQFKQNEMFAISVLFDKKVDDIFLPTNFTVRKV
ncbi:helix-turn-helix transcriptional regulator [Aerococcus urinaeequi]